MVSTGLQRALPEALEDKLNKLREELLFLERVVVALSGGVDSAFLAYAARSALGREAAFCVTAESPSLAPDELEDCRRLASELDLAWRVVPTSEMDDPHYVANGPYRCYFCKSALMDALEPLAEKRHATIVLGVNVDDLSDFRPGQQAARERGARFPLLEAGMTKADVREAAKAAGLSVWDKPAAACLASRIPLGTPVSREVLAQVAKAEAGLRRLGLRQLRVRHHGEVARLEVPLEDLGGVLERREAMVEACKAAGYRFVTLDLEGFRSGSLSPARK